MPPLLDLAWQVTAIGYAVEVFKDIFQRAPNNVVRAFMYAAAFILVALTTWKAGLPMNDYLLTVLVQGGSVATAAWAAHAGIKAVVPTLPTIAVAEAKVKATPVLRSKAELEAEGKAKEDAANLAADLASETARVTELVRRVLAEERAAVTPKRVEEAPIVPTKAIKDSS